MLMRPEYTTRRRVSRVRTPGIIRLEAGALGHALRMEEKPDGAPRREAEVREHLANERTLPSWVRTGVALISIGLVVERAGALAGTQNTPIGASGLFGVALALLGCLTLVIGTAQFLHNRCRIIEGDFTPAIAAYLVIVAGSMVLAAAFVVYVTLQLFP